MLFWNSDPKIGADYLVYQLMDAKFDLFEIPNTGIKISSHLFTDILVAVDCL